MIILLSVVLMPFSASMVGGYPPESLAKAFFDVNMLILSLLFPPPFRSSNQRIFPGG